MEPVLYWTGYNHKWLSGTCRSHNQIALDVPTFSQIILMHTSHAWFLLTVEDSTISWFFDSSFYALLLILSYSFSDLSKYQYQRNWYLVVSCTECFPTQAEICNSISCSFSFSLDRVSCLETRRATMHSFKFTELSTLWQRCPIFANVHKATATMPRLVTFSSIVTNRHRQINTFWSQNWRIGRRIEDILCFHGLL